MARSEYGRRSTESTPTTLRNGKKKQSRRTSLQLMDQGAEAVGLDQVEDEARRMIPGGGEDEALVVLLIE